MNSAIKSEYEEKASFNILKGIRLLNLRIKKSGLQEIIKCALWMDYTGTVDNPTLPTIDRIPEWKARWNKVKDTGLNGGFSA